MWLSSKNPGRPTIPLHIGVCSWAWLAFLWCRKWIVTQVTVTTCGWLLGRLTSETNLGSSVYWNWKHSTVVALWCCTMVVLMHRVCTHTHTHSRTQCIHKLTLMHLRMFSHILTYSHTHIYTHSHTHMHTLTHAHTICSHLQDSPTQWTQSSTFNRSWYSHCCLWLST